MGVTKAPGCGLCAAALARHTHRLMFLTRSLAASWFIKAINCGRSTQRSSERRWVASILCRQGGRVPHLVKGTLWVG